MKFSTSSLLSGFVATIFLIGSSDAVPHGLRASRHHRNVQSVCTASQILEFDCDIQNDVVGVYVCRDGQTTCTLTNDIMSSDSCGCCAGDTRLACLDDEAEDIMEGNSGGGTALSNNIADSSSNNGATVTGITFSSSISSINMTSSMTNGTYWNTTNATKINATVSTIVSNAGTGVTTSSLPGTTSSSITNANSAAVEVCTTFQKLEFDCDVANDVVGVYVCREGVTTCVLNEAFQTSDTCGCCPGDNRLDCLNDAQEDALAGNGGDNDEDEDENEDEELEGLAVDDWM